MRYIINDIVKYNSSDGTLLVIDNSIDMITLPRITNELLSFFIQSNGKSLSREDILNEIWEKRGLSSSSNNLSNYVSMLRKSLALCNCHDVLTTIPKYGFSFNADIIEDLENKNPLEENEEQSNKGKKNSSSPLNINKKIKAFIAFRPPKKNELIITALISFIAFISYSIYKDFTPEIEKTTIFRNQQCQFYSINHNMSDSEKNEAIKKIKLLADKSGLNCKNKINAYYFVNDRVDFVGDPVVNYAISFCEPQSKSPCVNFKIYEKKNIPNEN
ncbi:winged helix-turn-helix domain-containing protein [Serratia sp. NA_112.1]|uniref:winged helix-turn-helix domain-containing protein n=1 Tax=unclassified Serratia (in: enterobacteria) TaxID=2647522 RepID=UPI0040470016